MDNKLLGYSVFDSSWSYNTEMIRMRVEEAIDSIAFIPEGYCLRVEYHLVKDKPQTLN